MKRRLTLSILGTVAATLILAGVGTLLFSLIGATKATENDLRSQAEATAELIDASRAGQAQFSSHLAERLATQLCRAPESGPPDTEAARVLANLRNLLCDGQTGTVGTATAWLCDGGPNRLDRIMTPREAELRQQFCADPNEQTLSVLRESFCASATRPTTPAVRRQLQQLRTLICGASNRRSQQQAQLEQTLTKQSIDLVIVGPDDRIEPQTLTLDIPADRLDVNRLRAGETVSGRVDGRVFAAAPINPSDERMGVVLIDRNANPLRDSVQWFLMASGVTLLIGAAVAARLSQALTNRLRNATEATARIAAGDLTTRLPEHHRADDHQRDELDDLARSINTMAEGLERAQGLERQFLLSISHDLRTPLTSIRGYAEAIADGTAPDPRRAAGVILAERVSSSRSVVEALRG
ncbi:MAG: HAMP domain-containing protein, partial [Acidimicrobiales bacterium]|nr:HAMP domain-containing protein [Acidimicrobiales bacterium]